MGSAEILLVCDHASHAVPQAMDRLGLEENVIQDHIGWDIGALEVAVRMSEWLGVPAIVAGYSRLVIDYNRPPEATDRIPPVSDGVMIPGNQSLATEHVEARVQTFFDPYHETIANTIDAYLARDAVPVVVSIHSFAPMIGGAHRPWDACVCSDRDRRVAEPLMEELSKEGLHVGDNEPFAFEGPSDHTIPEHGIKRGLPHVLVEMRNDQLRDAEGVTQWAERLCRTLTTVLADPQIRRIERF